MSIVVHTKTNDVWSTVSRDDYDYSIFDFTEITHSTTVVVVENGFNMYTLFFVYSPNYGSSMLQIGLCSEQTSKIDPKFVRKVCERNSDIHVKLWTGFLHKLDSIDPDTVELVSEVSLTDSRSKSLFRWISKCYPQLRGKHLVFCGHAEPPPCVLMQFPNIHMFSYESEHKPACRRVCVAEDSDVMHCIRAL